MIVIAGGSGTLGTLLVRILVARGEHVRVLTRHPVSPTTGTDALIEVVQADVLEPATLDRALAGCATLVSAITGFAPTDAGAEAVDHLGNLALIEAAKRVGIEHVVLMSIVGVSDHHPSRLFRAKAQAEEALRASGLAWTIVRPTAYMETYLGLLGGPLVATGKTTVFGRGRNPVNFVSARDVARLVDLALLDPTLHGETLEIGGPADLTLDEVVAAASAASGIHGSVRHTPLAMMRVLASVLRPIRPRTADLIATAVVMDTQDMRFDGAPLRRRFTSVPATSIDEVAGLMFAVKAVDPASAPT